MVKTEGSIWCVSRDRKPSITIERPERVERLERPDRPLYTSRRRPSAADRPLLPHYYHSRNRRVSACPIKPYITRHRHFMSFDQPGVMSADRRTSVTVITHISFSILSLSHQHFFTHVSKACSFRPVQNTLQSGWWLISMKIGCWPARFIYNMIVFKPQISIPASNERAITQVLLLIFVDFKAVITVSL